MAPITRRTTHPKEAPAKKPTKKQRRHTRVPHALKVAQLHWQNSEANQHAPIVGDATTGASSPRIMGRSALYKCRREQRAGTKCYSIAGQPAEEDPGDRPDPTCPKSALERLDDELLVWVRQKRQGFQKVGTDQVRAQARIIRNAMWASHQTSLFLSTKEVRLFDENSDRRVASSKDWAPAWMRRMRPQLEDPPPSRGILDEGSMLFLCMDTLADDKFVYVTRDKLRDQGTPVAEKLRHPSTSYSKLALLNNELTPSGFAEIAEATKAQKITYLVVYQNACIQKPQLPKLAHLTSLVLWQCQINDDIIGALAEVILADGTCPLEELTLTRNVITSLGADAIGRALVVNRASCLKLLSLDSNRVDDSAQDFLTMLSIHPLEKLHLDKNRVSHELCRALAANPHSKLTDLQLGFNLINDKAVKELAKMKCLQTLKLTGNRYIHLKGIRALIDSREKFNGLASLFQFPTLQLEIDVVVGSKAHRLLEDAVQKCWLVLNQFQGRDRSLAPHDILFE